MSQENLRMTFDQDAELYDLARPGRPEALFDDLVELVALRPGGSTSWAGTRRAGLLGCMRDLIDDRCAGTVTKRYLYEMRVARTRLR